MEYIGIEFEKGLPTALKADGKVVTDSFELFKNLNKIGGKHRIGRLDIVESRFVGMKSRGCYETPGGTLLLTAHRGNFYKLFLDNYYL